MGSDAAWNSFLPCQRGMISSSVPCIMRTGQVTFRIDFRLLNLSHGRSGIFVFTRKVETNELSMMSPPTGWFAASQVATPPPRE